MNKKELELLIDKKQMEWDSIYDSIPKEFHSKFKELNLKMEEINRMENTYNKMYIKE